MPSAPARARPAAPERFERTRAISAGKPGFLAAAINATMLEPRPEIRTATRFLAMRSSVMGNPRLCNGLIAAVYWQQGGKTPPRVATAGRGAEAGAQGLSIPNLITLGR